MDPVARPSGGPRSWPWRNAAVAAAGGVVLAFLAGLALRAHVRGESRNAVQAWEGRLTAMADDRQIAIETWLRERWGDARVIANFPSVQDLVPGRGERGDDRVLAEERAHITGVLGGMAETYGYLGIYVLGGDGGLVTASPGAPELDRDVRAWAQGRRPALADDIRFFPGASEKESLIALSRDVVATGRESVPSPPGHVVITVTPTQWLYPLLAREPLSTQTGETLLVQREGSDLVFISPLRNRRGASFPLSLPLATPALAAAHAVEGAAGFGEYLDYRGAPVLAAVRRIRGTDVGLIVKVDREEALAPVRRLLALQALVLVTFLGLLASVAFGWWRQQRVTGLRAVLRERMRSEGRILQLNRLLTTIYEVNQLVVREADRERLMTEACRILVEHGQFVMAWVGLAQTDGRVVPAAGAGRADEYLKDISVRWDETTEGRGPTGTAIRENRHVVNADVTVNPAMAPWREKALRAGFRSSAAFPLRVRGRAAGALTVYMAEPGAIGDEEVLLLEKLADDLGHALDALEDRQERARAEAALRASEERWRAIVLNEPECVKVLDREGRLLEMNPAGLAMVQASFEQVAGRQVEALVAPEDRAAFARMVAGVFRGESRHLVFDMVGLEGRRLTLETTSVPLRDAAGTGEIRALLGVTRDITERRRAEAEREALLQIMKGLVSEPDLRSYLGLVHDSLSRVIYARNFFVMLQNPRTGAFEIPYIVDEYDERSPPTDLGRSLSAYVFRTGEALFVTQPLFDDLRTRGEVEEVGTPSPSWLGAPLRKGDHVTGVVAVQDYEKPGRYSERDRVFLSSVAAQVGVAIERQRDEEALRTSEERTRRVFEDSAIGMVLTGPDFGILDANQAFSAFIGYTREELVSLTFRDFTHPGHLAADAERMSLLLRGEIPVYRTEKRYARKDGKVVWGALNVAAVRDGAGRCLFLVAMVEDIDDRKRAEERLEHLAQHDPLTDLPNRLMLNSHLEHAIARGRRGGHQGAVLFLDLDRFKIVNDSLGHGAGDEVLRSTARRLRERLREEDLIARVGGDEFVVLLEEIDGPDAAAAVARDLIGRLREPFVLEAGREVYVGLSVGISVFPEDGDRAEILVQNADAALYAAKERGRNTFRFYSEALTIAATERLALEADLRRGLALGQFLLHYQPVVRLADGGTRSVEALVRWQSPERGLVMPASFIGVAEETGLIVPLGEEVLRLACRQMRSWLDRGQGLERIAVNISARQFLHQDLELRIESILAETGLAARHLELEITESALMEQGSEAESRLVGLKKLGIRLAIDDFGTGYSSLSRLRRFPIDTFKIDRSFIANVPDNRAQREIVLTIISLARQLGLHVVAEGVETEQQVAFLRENGCESAQGFFFGAPVPADDIHDAGARD